jgi:hypothetical protein
MPVRLLRSTEVERLLAEGDPAAGEPALDEVHRR